ncbi:MAG: hypothetical protein IT210_19395 [Armatimonadetes bacterium]|nr:hypothetical protein [Armatimonadota bacterium]
MGRPKTRSTKGGKAYAPVRPSPAISGPTKRGHTNEQKWQQRIRLLEDDIMRLEDTIRNIRLEIQTLRDSRSGEEIPEIFDFTPHSGKRMMGKVTQVEDGPFRFIDDNGDDR